MDYKSRLKTAGVYLLAVAISLLALAWVYKLWNAHMSVPLVYDGDATGDELFNGLLIKGIIDNGWYLNNGLLGAPTGLDLFDFPLADNLHFILIRFISLFAGDWAATMNLFYLATFPLAVVTSLFVFRRLQVSTPIAVVGSVLFAFLPYHFSRGEIHLFLAGIYIIPLSCLLVLRMCVGAPPFIRQDDGGEAYDFRSLRTLGYVIVAMLTASAGIYYAVFAGFFLVVAGVYASFTHRSIKRLAVAGIAIALIAIGILINISPSVIYAQKNSTNQAVAARSPNETAAYALTITPMILPVPGHRIGLLERVVTSSIRNTPSVPWSSSLGLIGASGLLFLFGWLILAKRREANLKKRFFPLIDSLSVLSISAILLAVSGGGGLFFALVISPEIRAYYRIGIYIGFFSILAALLVLEILRRKYVKTDIHGAVFYGILFVILVGGILDQTSYLMVPDYAMCQEEFSRDEAFIDEIESALPESAMVFQLPYLPFPESPKVNNMNDYNHLRGYLHSDSLRWSYPAMKGREGDLWLQEISGKPAEQLVRELAAAGFQGAYINRNGYQDGGAEIEQQLAAELHVIPIVNEDGTLAFYDMTDYTEKMS